MEMEAITDHGGGIHAVDTGYLRPGFDAAHLIVDAGEAAFVDCGTNSSVPRLLAALDALELSPASVRYLILTHIHLDHAGGAGALMRELPEAECVLHPRAERHMRDPSKLEAGTRAVYGDAIYEDHYGELVPIPEQRLRVMADEESLHLGDRELVFLHTEGHARHHHCILDPAHGAIFTGDSFGVSYRAFDTDAGAFIFPTTTPIHFDPDAAHASIDRILGRGPEAAFLTHYSRVTGLSRLAADLHRDLDALVAITEERDGEEAAIAEGLRGYLEGRLDEHGVAKDPELRETWLATDVALNAQGLAHWWQQGR